MLRRNEEWNEEYGIASVSIYDTKLGNIATGLAICSAEDKDMKSKLTGLEIATRKAEIALLKQYRWHTKNELNTLIKFEKSIKDCKHYNEDFQIECILRNKIQELKLDVAFYEESIERLKESLQAYIEAKGKLYHALRERRKNKIKGE